MSGYTVKLVRDDIGEYLGGHGTITYEQIDDHEKHVTLLRKKLVEEALEYLQEPTVGELADVLSVVLSLAVVDLDVTVAELKRVAFEKDEERGGFEHGVVMVSRHGEDR